MTITNESLQAECQLAACVSAEGRVFAEAHGDSNAPQLAPNCPEWPETSKKQMSSTFVCVCYGFMDVYPRLDKRLRREAVICYKNRTVFLTSCSLAY